MAQVLRRLTPASAADLLVATDTLDDAAVWRRPDGRALVATVDFFTPIVDDAATWGRIAAANAVSDVYAMGATPLFALNVAGWPRDRLPLDLLGDVLAGAEEVAAEGGWAIVGGHTIDAPEPLYGQAVVGEVDEARMLTNAGGRPGDAVVLTKPIGTGLVATAVKRSPTDAVAEGGALEVAYRAAVASMTRLNREGAAAAHEAGATAATDVTGFGLLGHLHELARASGVAAELEVAAVPLLPGALDLVDGGFIAGGTERNARHVGGFVRGDLDRRHLLLLADAQTSGGLLVSAPPDRARRAVDDLRASGHDAAVIGSLVDGAPGELHVR